MQYHLLDLGALNSNTVQIANSAFLNWKSVFSEEMNMRNLVLHENDFWNSKLLAVITDQNEVVGSHIYNVFDLRTLAVSSHSYLCHFSESNISEIRKQGIHHLMSLEYLCVNPKYRGKSSGFSWGEIVVGLGYQVLRHSNWCAAIGIAREDRKVDKMASQLGAQTITHFTMNQTPCSVVLMKKSDLRPHSNSLAQKTIENLWNHVLNHSPFVEFQNHQQSLAA